MQDFVLTQNRRDKIREMNGTDVKLVGRLSLKFPRDICSEFLMIPPDLLLNLILSPNEKQKLNNVGDTLEVKLIEPEGDTSSIKLVKKGTLMYALGSEQEWRNVVARNHFRVDVPIDLWSFVDGESTRCFTMEYVHGIINQGSASTSTHQD